MNNFLIQIYINELMCIWQGYPCALFKLFTNSLDKSVCDMVNNGIKFVNGTILKESFSCLFVLFLKIRMQKLLTEGKNKQDKISQGDLTFLI